MHDEKYVAQKSKDKADKKVEKNTKKSDKKAKELDIYTSK